MTRLVRRQFLFLTSAALLALAAACSGNSSKPPATVPPPTAANAVKASVVPAAPGGQVATIVPVTPPAGSASAPGATPAANSACAPFQQGPAAPATNPVALTAAVSGGSPQPNVPQPARPPVDLSAFTIPVSDLPSGWVSFNDSPIQPQDLYGATLNPQATAAFLTSIGYLAGRVQAWSGPLTDGRYPTVIVQHLAFTTDAGASAFLRSPSFNGGICIRGETAAQIGQETSSFFYQYIGKLQNGTAAPFEGHTEVFRCGRVDVSISGAGGPNQLTKSYIDDLANRVFAEYQTSKQPCS